MANTSSSTSTQRFAPTQRLTLGSSLPFVVFSCSMYCCSSPRERTSSTVRTLLPRASRIRFWMICSASSGFASSRALNSLRGITANSEGSTVFTQAERGLSSSIISPT